MPTDDPVRNMLPTFSQPPTLELTPGDPAPDPATESPLAAPSPGPARIPAGRTRRLLPDGVGPAELEDQRPDPDPTPTDTSSASRPSAAVTAGLIAAAIGMVTVAAATVVRWRMARTLRQPTKPQRADIAGPLARIALRHADLSWLNKDLADVLEAGNAVGAYLNDGDLLLPLHPDAGVPDHLQETPA